MIVKAAPRFETILCLCVKDQEPFGKGRLLRRVGWHTAGWEARRQSAKSAQDADASRDELHLHLRSQLGTLLQCWRPCSKTFQRVLNWTLLLSRKVTEKTFLTRAE